MKRLSLAELKTFLDEKVEQFNQRSFIESDPISIPHAFTRRQDIEIAGLFAALLAWGQRGTIIRKCRELMQLMDNSPYDFIVNHKRKDLKNLEHFKHRTFNAVDALYFVSALQRLYASSATLEKYFACKGDENIEQGLISFHRSFFDDPDHPGRTKKHLPTPERGSTCKRISMYLRWMVRSDNQGVDFGLWKSIQPSQLICPLDLHVDRVSRRLKLIRRKQTDWQTALELTKKLRQLDPVDPVRYDFALFGLGVEKKW